MSVGMVASAGRRGRCRSVPTPPPRPAPGDLGSPPTMMRRPVARRRACRAESEGSCLVVIEPSPDVESLTGPVGSTRRHAYAPNKAVGRQISGLGMFCGANRDSSARIGDVSNLPPRRTCSDLRFGTLIALPRLIAQLPDYLLFAVGKGLFSYPTVSRGYPEQRFRRSCATGSIVSGPP